jgi:hypothetical protein
MTPTEIMMLVICVAFLALFTWSDYHRISQRSDHLRERLLAAYREKQAWTETALYARRAWWDAFSASWLAIGLQRRIDAAGMDALEDLCPGCLRSVDDRTCWCGAEIDASLHDSGSHAAVPMGCECHRLPHVGEEAISYWRGRARVAETYLHGKVWYDPPKASAEPEPF